LGGNLGCREDMAGREEVGENIHHLTIAAAYNNDIGICAL
jgi:hypothetical protein